MAVDLNEPMEVVILEPVAFYKAVSEIPPGARVALNDGSINVIKSINPVVVLRLKLDGD